MVMNQFGQSVKSMRLGDGVKLAALKKKLGKKKMAKLSSTGRKRKA